MSHFCTNLTPLGVGRAIGKFDKVESILNIRLKIVERYMNAGLGGILILELTRESAGDNGQSLGSEVFTKLEELEEAKSVALEIVGEITIGECIVPAVFVKWTVLNFTY